MKNQHKRNSISSVSSQWIDQDEAVVWFSWLGSVLWLLSVLSVRWQQGRPGMIPQVVFWNNTRLTALIMGLPGWAGTRKLKPIWSLLKQETVSGGSISLAICKSAPCSGQITMPAPHHSVFYRLDALPATQPTASKQWRHKWRKGPCNWLMQVHIESGS